MFLQHLAPLMGLAKFAALWVTIIEFMRTFYTATDKSSGDLLLEAIPESLKNMLLVQSV